MLFTEDLNFSDHFTTFLYAKVEKTGNSNIVNIRQYANKFVKDNQSRNCQAYVFLTDENDKM